MATNFKFEIESDGLTTEQANAFSAFVQTLGGGTSKQEAPEPKQEASEPKQEAEQPKQEAEQPKQEAEQPKQEAEQPKQEQPKSKYDIADVKERVKAKQKAHRAAIIAKLKGFDATAVSTLDPAHFTEMCEFLDGLE